MMLVEIINKAVAYASGLHRYFPGTQCPKGHVAERLTFNGKCTECIREASEQSHQVQAVDFRIARRLDAIDRPDLPELVYQNVPEAPAPAVVAPEPPPIPEAIPAPSTARPMLQLSRRPLANIVSARGKAVVVEKIGRRRSKPSLSDLVAAAVAPAPVEVPLVVEKPAAAPVAHVMEPDPSIAHLFDRSMDAKPLRARPGAELVPLPEPYPVEDPTGGSKRITARAPVERAPRAPRAPKVDRSEMYGPFRPRGNPKWYKMKAERMAAEAAAAVVETPPVAAPVEVIEKKPRKPRVAKTVAPVEPATKLEVKRIRNRITAQQKAQAKTDRMMQFINGNW